MWVVSGKGEQWGVRGEDKPKCSCNVINPVSAFKTISFYYFHCAVLPSIQYHHLISPLNRLDFKVRWNQWQHKRLQVLNQVIKHLQALRISTGLNIGQRANFRGLCKERKSRESASSSCQECVRVSTLIAYRKTNVFVSQNNFQLLSPFTIRMRP